MQNSLAHCRWILVVFGLCLLLWPPQIYASTTKQVKQTPGLSTPVAKPPTRPHRVWGLRYFRRVVPVWLSNSRRFVKNLDSAPFEIVEIGNTGRQSMVLYSDVQQAMQGFAAFYNRRDFSEDATSSLFLLAWDELDQFYELDPEAPRGRLYCPNSILPTPREIYELRDVYRNMVEFELEESLDDILRRPQPYRPMRVSRTPERTISSMSRARQFVQDTATLVGANCEASREQGPTCDEAAARIPDQELEALIDSALDLERDSSNLDAVVRAEGESCHTRAENIIREAPGLPPAILDVTLDLINAQCPNDPDCSAIDFLANSADSSIFESLIESLLEATDDPVCSVEGPTAAKSRKLNDCLHKQFNDDADYAWSAVFEAATVHPSVMRYLCPVNQVTQGAEACLRDEYDYATYNALGAIVDSPPEFYDQVANVLDHTCPPASNPESSNSAQDLRQIRIQEFNDFMDQASWRFGLPAEELLERIDQGIENLRHYWPDIWSFLRQFPALFNFWLSTPSFSFCLSSGPRKRAHRPGVEEQCRAVMQVMGKYLRYIYGRPHIIVA